MTLEITLSGNVPSKKNSKRLIMRGGKRFFVPSEAHEAWHEEQMYRLGKFRSPKLKLDGLKMTMTLYAGDARKGDLSNKFESIADLFVDAGIIADDNWTVVSRVELIYGGIDRERPRAEIIVEEI